MPRTAQNRAFGFRQKGLLRILTAADPDEVLSALLLLGMDPRPFDEMQDLVDQFTEAVIGLALGTFSRMLNVGTSFAEVMAAAQVLKTASDFRVGNKHSDSHQAEIDIAYDRLQLQVRMTSKDIQQLKSFFKDRMGQAQKVYPPLDDKIPDQAFQE